MLIFKKEKEVRKLILQHFSTTHDCLSAARSMLEDYVSGESESAAENARRVKSLEQQADGLKRQAREVLHRGAFLPQIRADIHRLVESVDGIAGAAEDAAKFLMNQSPFIPQDFESDLLEIFGLSVTCFHELRKALKDYIKPEGEIESMHEHVQKVGLLESEIDNKQAALTKRLFDSGLDLAAKMHLCQFVRLIAGISDLAEDVSDELESVVMRSVV